LNERIKKLKEKIKEHELSGIIVSNPINIRYLTGLTAEGTLIIGRYENNFITDSRYIEEVMNIIKVEDELIVQNLKNLKDEDYEHIFLRDSHVGFEENYITYAGYKELKAKYKVDLVETESMIESLRSVKDEDEIECIKKACEITDNAFNYIVNNLKFGMTEKQLANKIERYMISEGADGVAFETIVASGENSSKPHSEPTDRVIKQGDIVLIDMGAKYHGYCSDMSRTVFVGSCKYEKEYNFVLDQQKKITSSFKAGSNIKTVIDLAEKDYEVDGYEIMHAFGHNLGLEVHEEPALRNKEDSYLEKNMVIAVEPGIYDIGNYGIRIEDTYLVTNTGVEQLTKSDKSIIVV
jgi:Xaa-Pro aminopeptidase